MLVLIGLLSPNSKTTKYVPSYQQNIECKTDNNQQLKYKHNNFDIVVECLFWTLNQVPSLSQCFYC